MGSTVLNQSLTQSIKAAAEQLGFALLGVCPAVQPRGLARFDEWLTAGYAGEMRYLPERREAYSHPNSILSGVCSIVMLAMDYRTLEPSAPQSGRGRVSRYAWGVDYHALVHDRLESLCGKSRELCPPAAVRGVVDTAPLLEREFAELAGLGWIGKNTLLLNTKRGSWFFLAALLTDQLLVYDTPHEQDHCGTCRACLDACPTQAFAAPGVLDARRCISYLTIELRSQIPRELRPGIGDWLFGCDVCQDVCPWNHRAPESRESAFQPIDGETSLSLAGLFEMDQAAFRARFRHTPLWRSKRRGLLRNAAIVLGNQRDPASLPTLVRALADEEPLVRGAAAWALGQLASEPARDALRARKPAEHDADVRAEIEWALADA
ncbi:MAG TPA: tRNA epoxyqueuosine(34) reductase QueG [Pirellulales bacterium]|jgi:epoxyqueuosine reductase|nr:tRNA epoxyqueuosine(34) reductase QueG [Pirellulales bacterium]